MTNIEKCGEDILGFCRSLARSAVLQFASIKKTVLEFA